MQLHVQSPFRSGFVVGSVQVCPAAVQVAAEVPHSSSLQIAGVILPLPVVGASQTHSQLLAAVLSLSTQAWPEGQSAALSRHSSVSQTAGACCPVPVAGAMHLHSQSLAFAWSGSLHDCPATVQVAEFIVHSPTSMQDAALCWPSGPTEGAIHLHTQSPLLAALLLGSSQSWPLVVQIALLLLHSSSSQVAGVAFARPDCGASQTHSQLSATFLSTSWHVCPIGHCAAFAKHSSSSQVATPPVSFPTFGAMQLQTQSLGTPVFGSSQDCPAAAQVAAFMTHSPTSVHVAGAPVAGVPVAGATQLQVQSPVVAAVLSGSSHVCPFAVQTAAFVTHSSRVHVAAAIAAEPVEGALQSQVQSSLETGDLFGSLQLCPAGQVIAFATHSSSSHVATPCIPVPV